MQGGSKGAVGARAKLIEAGGTDLSGAKINQGTTLGKGATQTINNSGLSVNDVNSLLGAVTQATASQLQEFQPAAAAPATGPAPTTATPDTSAAAAKPFDWTPYKTPGAILAGLVILYFFFFQKR